MLLCIDYIHCTGLVQLFTNRLYTGPDLCIDTSYLNSTPGFDFELFTVIGMILHRPTKFYTK